jgi:hypothetical protein
MRHYEKFCSALFTKILIAVLLHRPGLWLLCGVKVSARVRQRNKIAVLAVVLAMIAAASSVPTSHRLFAALLVFVVGHLLWGTYLAFTVVRN